MAGFKCSMPSLLLALTMLCISCLLTSLLAADDDPLQDFCVSNANDVMHTLTLNGFPCKPSSQVLSSDFASSLLRSPGSPLPALGFAVNIASAVTFPALNTQGLTVVRTDLQPKGVTPPHVHPRATEVLFLARGTLIVGFVSTAAGNPLFQQTLHEGDLFVFPRGLVHFQLNPDPNQHAMAISALNSQNPGVSLVAASLFATTPRLPEEVLGSTFGIDRGEVDRLIASVAVTLAT